MQVKPVPGPAAVQSNTGNSQTQLDARQRAIQRIQGNQAQSPVQNQNAISPEEIGAIKQATGLHGNTGEETVESPEVTEEAPVEPKEEKKPDNDPLSRQYAILARQEKALRAKQQQQDQAFKAKEEALTAREQQVQERLKQYEQGYISKDQLLRDPVAAFEAMGLDYDKITQAYLNYQQIDPRVNSVITQLQDEIKALKAGKDEERQKAQENESQAYKAAVQQIKTDVTDLVNSDPNYETVKATGSIKDVVELIEKTYHAEGKLLTIEEASQQVEDYLIEEIEKIARLDKIQKRLGSNASPKNPEAGSKPAAPAPKQQQPMKTLTNASSSTRQLSARERAIAKFKGEAL